MRKLVDNKDGLGLVAMFHQQILDEQIEFVKGLELQSKSLEDLPQRTPEQELDMAWEEGLNTL